MSFIPIVYKTYRFNVSRINYRSIPIRSTLVNKNLYGLFLSFDGFHYYNNLRRADHLTEIQEWNEIKRDDPLLVETIRKFGQDASFGEFYKLDITNIPSEYITSYKVYEYKDTEIIIYDPQDLTTE